ncbi:MAG TPA: response regulator transcription factor [Herpetosiphonaceae bacterium]
MIEEWQPSSSSMVQQRVIRVVVADDHPVVRNGIVHELARQPDIEVLGTAENGNVALHLVSMIQPDVLVTDLNMPGLRAVDVVRRARTLPVPPNILILTAYAELDYVQTFMDAGATGYLLKEEDPSAISAAVRSVARGEPWLSSRVAGGRFDQRVRGSGEPAQPLLSMRGLDVLRLVVEGKTNQEIGIALGISEKTVEKHLAEVYVKLGVSSRVEAAVRAVREGLV